MPHGLSPQALQLRLTRLADHIRSLPAPPQDSRALVVGEHPSLHQVLTGKGYRVLVLPRPAASSSPAIAPLGSLEGIELPDGQCHLAVLVDALEPLVWGRWGLQEIARILAPGGTLLFAITNPQGLTRLVDRHLWGRLGRKLVPHAHGSMTGWPSPHLDRPFFHSFPTLERLAAQLPAIGLRPVTWTAFGWGPVTGEQRYVLALHHPARLADRLWPQANSRLAGWANHRMWHCVKEPDHATRGVGVLPEGRLVCERAFEQIYATPLDHLDSWLRQVPPATAALGTSGNPDLPPGPLLLLSPHPDDEIIGCGGLLLAARARGREVHVLQLTDGGGSVALEGASTEVREGIRFQEAARVARSLGAVLHHWHEPGNALRAGPEQVARLEELLRTIDPRTILVPFINDRHPDHSAANRILAAALGRRQPAASMRILSYEVWSLVPANWWLEISRFQAAKAALLMQYRTGMKSVDYVRHCLFLNRHHAWQRFNRPGLMEAFQSLPVPAYLDQVARAEPFLAGEDPP
ncbi:MAG: PIG-L family deacetylase [Magnetococcales bacterium]|nr:PIG-L family deacetylase [Magnetococcales bacterium]